MDDQDEVAGHQVGHLLYGRLAGLGILDQADDLRQRRVSAHLGGLEAQGSGAVDRAADDLAPAVFSTGMDSPVIIDSSMEE